MFWGLWKAGVRARKVLELLLKVSCSEHSRPEFSSLRAKMVVAGVAVSCFRGRLTL